MKLRIDRPGLLTTVQDLGRWGFQGKGMPVAGAMDPIALRMGNIMMGNEEGAAALEMTVMGPSITVTEGEGVIAATGADLGLAVNGERLPAWHVTTVSAGDTISFRGPSGRGCRSYLCVSGGIDVPPVMGSRSTYLRAHIGGLGGRALASGDVLTSGDPHLLWRRFAGFECPEELLPDYDPERPLKAVPGPQDDCFTEEGLELFFSSTYTITNAADRMGYRLEGPEVEHREGADIVSDAIPLGSIQVPGHQKPIVMLADRQTTGGYTKIAVLCTPDIGYMAQRLPGQTVRFQRVDQASAAKETARFMEVLNRLRQARASYSSRPSGQVPGRPAPGEWDLKIRGGTYSVLWRRIIK